MELHLKEGSYTEVELVDAKSPVDPFGLPYTSRLSFLPLIRTIERIVEDDVPGEAELASFILERLSKVPALYEPIEDRAILDSENSFLYL